MCWFFKKKENIAEALPESRIVKKETKGPDDVVTRITYEYHVLRTEHSFGAYPTINYYKCLYENGSLDFVKSYKENYEYIKNCKTPTTIIE